MDNYMTPFALCLGATNPQIGLLIAIPNLLGAIFQTFAVEAVHKIGSRLKLVVHNVGLQALMLLPIGFLGLRHVPHRLLWLIGFVTIYKIITGLIGPAWGSLVSEYLPAHRRGDYFGWRSRILGITSLVTIIFWGGFLDVWKKIDKQEIGFLAMFLTAAVGRFVSFALLRKHVDLPFHHKEEHDFTLWMFLKRFRESNFVKFVFYVAGITFTTNIAAPYFSVTMLRDLKFDYLSFMLVTLASTVTSLIAFPLWGRHADHVGNARILKTTSFLLPLIPIPWILFHHIVPIFLVEAAAGFLWGGFNLCAVNYIYDAVSPGKRMRCLGYFNLINGLAIFGGALVGSWLSSRVPNIFGYPLLTLFLISAVGRYLVHFVLSGKFTEVRSEVKHVSSTKLFFSVVGIQPMIGRFTETNALSTDVNFGPKPR